METERPMSDTELLAIDGVGKAKLKKYGDAL
jgi:ATP-dependent DNA helicase RecQ